MANKSKFLIELPVKHEIQITQPITVPHRITDRASHMVFFLACLVFSTITLMKAQVVTAALGVGANPNSVADSPMNNKANIANNISNIEPVRKSRKSGVAPIEWKDAGASGNVSLLIEEPFGDAGEFLGAGHISMYFSKLCTDSAANLRPCREGEEGAVVTIYSGWGDSVPHSWLAVPRTVFFYGVDNERDMPLYANVEIRDTLREAFRKKHLRDIIPDTADGSLPPGRWNDMIGAAMDRDIYELTIKTTPEQDAKFLADFNAIPDQHAFGQMYNNCADFARKSMNQVFPHSTHRDVLNDFTMSTPKALARSFTKYASARPELMFHMEKRSQVDGALRRSLNSRNFMEKVLVSRKYYLVIAATEPLLLGAFAGSYFLTGYYNLDSQYHKYAIDKLSEQDLSTELHDIRESSAESSGPAPMDRVGESTEAPAHEEATEKKEAVRTRLFGTNELWKHYKTEFQPMLLRAIETRIFLDHAEVKSFYEDLELQSEPAFDSEGGLILKVADHGTQRILGITRANILSPASDRMLAYKLMLSKVNYMLGAPGRNRVSIPAFERDWALMKQLSEQTNVSVAQPELGRPDQPRFRQANKVLSGKKKMEQYLMDIMH